MTTAKQREKLKALGWRLPHDVMSPEIWTYDKTLGETTQVILYSDGGRVCKGNVAKAVEFAAVLKEDAE